MKNFNDYFSKDDIKMFMRDGLTADDLARAFANQLNEAMADKAKEEATEKETVNVLNYLRKRCPTAFCDLTIEDLNRAFENIEKLAVSIDKLRSECTKSNPMKTTVKFNRPEKDKSLDELLEIFGR